MDRSSKQSFPTATVRLLPGDQPSCRVEVPTLEVRVEQGEDMGARVARAQGVVRVGTSRDNDLVLADAAVSRHHLEIRSDAQGVTVRDLGSKNGTFVDEVRVEAAPLGEENRVRLGRTVLRVGSGQFRRRAPVREVERFGSMVGASPVMRELFALVEAVAGTEISVLLLGESGTGKELLAREIHERSGRTGELVTYDAGLADPETLRSDLFGHRVGAFTGATSDRAGAFRRAHGGTLFLDEVGELPLELQTSLLRVLETGEVTPMGADRSEVVEVRVVAATHRDLAELVRAGRFREDLYHRLAVLPVSVPPLRERGQDVLLLARALAEARGHSLEWTPEAEARLLEHRWPGNVRALRNLLDRLSVLVRGRPVEARDIDFGPLGGSPLGGGSSHLGGPASLATPGALPPGLPVGGPPLAGGPSRGVGSVVEEAERQAIEAALVRCGGHRRRAAAELGISLATLKRRLRRYREQDAARGEGSPEA